MKNWISEVFPLILIFRYFFRFFLNSWIFKNIEKFWIFEKRTFKKSKFSRKYEFCMFLLQIYRFSEKKSEVLTKKIKISSENLKLGLFEVKEISKGQMWKKTIPRRTPMRTIRLSYIMSASNQYVGNQKTWGWPLAEHW